MYPILEGAEQGMGHDAGTCGVGESGVFSLTGKLTDRSLSYQMICSTVRLSSTYPDREGKEPTTSDATGFLFDLGGRVAVITNKHVLVDDRKKRHAVKVVVHYARMVNGERTLEEYPVATETALLAWHPDNGTDLAAICIDGLISELPKGLDSLDHRVLSCDNLPDDDYLAQMDAIEEVLMVGYPDGRVDELNGLPFVRRGITATPYELGFRDDESGDNSFLLDIECVKGSSGSPIFAVRADRIILLGINKQNRTQKGRIDGLHLDGANITYDHPIHLSVCTKSALIPELKAALDKGGNDISLEWREATPDEKTKHFI